MRSILLRLWKPALLAAGLVLAGVALREGQAQGLLEPGELDRMLGFWGLPRGLTFVALGAAACAVGVPRQAVAFAGGTVFGALVGAQLALLAMLVGAAASFFYARAIGREWARRRLKGGFARLDRFLAANPFTATLTLRLLPVGNNLALNLLAGLSGIPALPFFAASALGYLPQTVVFSLLGKGVRVDGAAQIALGVTLFVASGAFGLMLLRRHRLAQAVVPAGPDDVLASPTGVPRYRELTPGGPGA